MRTLYFSESTIKHVIAAIFLIKYIKLTLYSLPSKLPYKIQKNQINRLKVELFPVT